jgi:hypothetical protein
MEMPSESASTPSAPSTIGSRLPGSQIQMVSPIAVRSVIAVSTGTTVRRTRNERRRPTISTITDPPASAKSGESSL